MGGAFRATRGRLPMLNKRLKKAEMTSPKFTRRSFIAATLAAGSIRAIPAIATKTGGRRILTLVYDKSLGMMRAVERVVP